MKNILLFLAIVFIYSCTAPKMSVPSTFTSEATRMPVKGLNGWQINQKLSFGDYTTSAIKRGWDFTASIHYTKFSLRPEEFILKVFDINTEKNINIQKNKFHYTMEARNLMSEIFAIEKFNEKQLVYKSNNPWIGNASKTNRYEYAFTAAILPLNVKSNDPWSLVLINKYDIAIDTARKPFDKPYIEEEGYATNGKENIAIRSLRTDEVTNSKGEQTKVWGGKILTGYELQKDGRVITIIDLLGNEIWIHNNLEPQSKLIVASISSAILLKRMQDVEKDREHFDQ